MASSIAKVVHQAVVSCHKAGARNCSSAIWDDLLRDVFEAVFFFIQLMTTHFHIMYFIYKYQMIFMYIFL